MGTGDMDAAFDIDDIQLAPLMFQTGYLTIDGPAEGPEHLFRLKAPNLEVRKAFSLHLAAILTGNDTFIARTTLRKMSEALQTGDLVSMREEMKRLFSSIPYEQVMDAQAYYHSVFHAVMTHLGFNIVSEMSVAGEIDAVLTYADTTYVFELKYAHCDKDADEETKRELFEKTLDLGVEQILDRGYADRYMGGGSKVVQTAFAFLGWKDIEMRVIE